ncbi:SsrA-binding protein [Sporolactobacillus nakayamae]|uniref:SsrA-binding protein n=2 Tax=Sporolactobacillus nakayamae TaxID=269670 RepID=A0A1I2SNU3_9BACL|nr:SsrA-binding protein [Sporolactobacillus nakayamae]
MNVWQVLGMGKGESRVLAQNKKASHEYFIEETVEAGIVLQGTEIKAIRRGKVNIQDAFARVENGEAFVYNMHISQYEQGNRYNHDPLRTRKLLMHQKEINKLGPLADKTGYALIPLKIYIKNGFAKVLVGLGRGKKMYDKRESLKKQTAQREMARAFRDHQKM